MRNYLVDGTNAARRGGFDPRFPQVEQGRTQDLLEKWSRLAEPLNGRIRIEVFFDGPRREVGSFSPPVFVRFPTDQSADDAILGSARRLLNEGKGAVVVTADGALAREAEDEGARVLSVSAFEQRLRDDRA
ncbi:MAG: hypothetical protein A2X36_14580 [Elusimicrobia bacterium GWA2_69_24]|nr:MAG: hypothetical protein A2X36_14580 [Elusimicrobia bacterium GWA2_69_24]HBL18380.1 hypothetical protein [Elusimicrobiota bacterium]